MVESWNLIHLKYVPSTHKKPLKNQMTSIHNLVARCKSYTTGHGHGNTDLTHTTMKTHSLKDPMNFVIITLASWFCVFFFLEYARVCVLCIKREKGWKHPRSACNDYVTNMPTTSLASRKTSGLLTIDPPRDRSPHRIVLIPKETAPLPRTSLRFYLG